MGKSVNIKNFQKALQPVTIKLVDIDTMLCVFKFKNFS